MKWFHFENCTAILLQLVSVQIFLNRYFYKIMSTYFLIFYYFGVIKIKIAIIMSDIYLKKFRQALNDPENKEKKE